MSTPTPLKWLLVCGLLVSASTARPQGSLTPPGAPAPTLKTLTQIQPRTDVQKLAGDATSLFLINQPGSYYLTTNVVGASAKNGIVIASDNVVLDLNGFALIGVPGALRGVFVTGTRRNISVYNGSVQNWPSNGVDLGSALVGAIKDLQVSGNGGIGIVGGESSVVSDCTSRQNTNDNIRAGIHAVLTQCAAVESRSGHGINASGYGLVSQCTANSNKLNGIQAIQRMRVSDCVANNNGQAGVHITFVGTVERCFCNENSISGIQMDAGGFVDILNNTCTLNGTAGSGAGIRVSAVGGCRIEGNNVVQNPTGIFVLSARNVITRNVAAANNTDYDIAGGNAQGPVVNAVAGGDLSLMPGGNNPFANIRY